MKAKEFLEKLEIRVNGPKYRGAPMPKTVDTSINESAFADEFRFKEYNFDGETLKWVSQEWNYDHYAQKRFFSEIARCLEVAADQADLEEDVNITVDLRSRDNYPDEHIVNTLVIHKGV